MKTLLGVIAALFFAVPALAADCCGSGDECCEPGAACCAMREEEAK